MEVVGYEQTHDSDFFFYSKVLRSLDDFKDMADVIIASRMSSDLCGVSYKVFTRDLFGTD